MEYLWEKGLTPPEFHSLDGDKRTGVLVIGGGMAGILTALKLKEAGVDTVLVEAKRVGGGITKGTTAVLTAQHDTLYSDLIKKLGEKKARLYLDANLNAVGSFERLSAKYPCSFEKVPSVMYTTKEAERLKKEVNAVRSLGFPAELTNDVPLPFRVTAVRFPDMAQFHPLKFLYNASAELEIYENTFVKKLEGTTAVTDRGRIRADAVVVATHFPFYNGRGLFFAKLYQERSYVIALKEPKPLGCTVDNLDKGGFFLRSYKDMLLIGGGTERVGQGQGFAPVRAFVKKYYPGAKEAAAWANQDCVSLDGVPYIGRYSPKMKNVYIATGFNLWGMTSSMVSAEILTDAVLGRKNEYSALFDPGRSMMSAQLFKNAGETVLNFAVPQTRRCPHLGCALTWNKAEHTWDCSCHGSRFGERGKLIDGPAMKDANV